jgi:hypothetical protein
MGGAQQLTNGQLAELARLADGSLPPPRHARVAAGVERSPELRALVDEQHVALVALRSLDAVAPAGLRARVAATSGQPRRGVRADGEGSAPPGRPRCRERDPIRRSEI